MRVLLRSPAAFLLTDPLRGPPLPSGRGNQSPRPCTIPVDRAHQERIPAKPSLTRRPPADYERGPCPGGGIGRRAGFRYQWVTPWRFESSPGHHHLATVLEANDVIDFAGHFSRSTGTQERPHGTENDLPCPGVLESSYFVFRKRVPADLLAKAQGQRVTIEFPEDGEGRLMVSVTIAPEIKFSLKARDPANAKGPHRLRGVLLGQALGRHTERTEATHPKADRRVGGRRLSRLGSSTRG